MEVLWVIFWGRLPGLVVVRALSVRKVAGSTPAGDITERAGNAKRGMPVTSSGVPKRGLRITRDISRWNCDWGLVMTPIWVLASLPLE